MTVRLAESVCLLVDATETQIVADLGLHTYLDLLGSRLLDHLDL